jgi:hypothetical protein
MSKRLTVFYSWQSDTPSKANRNFIEKALREALKRLHSDATVEPALREASLELDKDTQGVAGSPPITETILAKIAGCTVFVADLTFVGQSLEAMTRASGKPRLFPNPNVLIEYGYALKCHTHGALVGILNSAYGQPDAANLPFNLRHLRRPITYHLAESSDAGAAAEFEKLVLKLVEALRLILADRTPPIPPGEPFVRRKPTKNAALFFDDPAGLVPRGEFGGAGESFVVPTDGIAYLRLHPAIAVPAIDTELEARDLARKAGLRPPGQVSGWNVVRNPFGAIVYDAMGGGKLYHLTQLFLSREIWGVDARCVNATYIRERTKGRHGNFIYSTMVEDVFVEALISYMKAAEAFLQLPLPLLVEAGLVGIKGHSIAAGQSVRGEALVDHIVGHYKVESYQTPAHEILRQFFQHMWAKCGVERPISRQADLAKRFEGAA